MKARYWLLASILFKIISTISQRWFEDEGLSSISGWISIILLACSFVLFISNKSGIDPLKHLLLLKRFIIILLVISAITFIFCAESVGADDFDGGIIALYALIVLLPTEIVVIIISTIVYYAKKKKYNATEEEISEDNSDETKL